MRRFLALASAVLALCWGSNANANGSWLARMGNAVAAYVAQAVHFGPAVNLTTTSALTGVSDTSLVTVSFWIKGLPTTSSYTNGGASLLNGDPVSNNCATGTSESCKGFNVSFDNSGSQLLNIRANLNNSSSQNCNLATATATLTDTNWHHVLMEWNTSNTTSTAKNAAIYFDRTKVAGGCTAPSTAAFLANVSSATGFSINKAQGAGPDPADTFEIAELYVDFAHADVDTSNNISAAGIAKFNNGTGPVSLGSTCSLPFGAQPAICYTGGAAGWATNKGSSTNLTLTATQGAAITAAATSPAVTPATHQAYLYCTPTMGSFVTVATITTNSGGCTIPTGALIINGVSIRDSSGTPAHAPTCPTGFTQLYNASSSGGSGNDPVTFLVCYKLAGASETGAYTFNWTTNAARTSEYFQEVYANVNQTTPVDAASSGQGSGLTTNGTSLVAPALASLSDTNETAVLIAFPWAAAQTTIPSGLNFNMAGLSVNNPTTLVDKVLTSNSLAAQTFTMGTGAGYAVSIGVRSAP